MSKTKIKSELKSALKNVNLTTATIKDIQNAIKQNSPQIYSEVMSKITDIEKILKQNIETNTNENIFNLLFFILLLPLLLIKDKLFKGGGAAKKLNFCRSKHRTTPLLKSFKFVN